MKHTTRNSFWISTLAVCAVVVGALAATHNGGDGRSGPSSASRPAMALTVAPAVVHKHDRVAVTITVAHATGVFGPGAACLTATPVDGTHHGEAHHENPQGGRPAQANFGGADGI